MRGRAWVTGVAQLVVSELVTNARKYAPGPYEANVQWVGPELEITVWDTDPVLPVARTADPGRVGGHGLEIVTALCESFEVRREPFDKAMFAQREVAESLAGAVSGAIPPFSFDTSLALLVGPELLKQEEVYFNAARLDRSLPLATADYMVVAGPDVLSISEPAAAPLA